MVSEHATPSPAPSTAQVLVASNRGPITYTLGEDGTLDAKRGGGGLVSGLSAVDDKLWVCAALGDGDREAVRRGVGEPGVRMLDIDAEVHADAYNGIANSVLWFVHHLLYQTPVEPVFDAEFRRRWASYETYNRAFAQALAEEAGTGAAVLVQDYHLALVPGMLRELRPDLRIGHFSHTPWAPVDYFRLLPDDIGEQLLRGILGADRAAFLTRRWADAFISCCTEILGGTGRTRIGVHGLGADADFLRRRSQEADVDERMEALREQVGEGRKTIVRVDRTELSKNIVRGLHAYRALLDAHPEWRERVVHVAFAYPSRQDLAVYRDYTAAVQSLATEINGAYGTESWTPVVLHVKDDFARSLAAYRLADVALVNPIRDGMNLVAKEVPVVSDHGCALVLSREAGAYEELGEDAIVVNPYDVVGTAEALHEALSMSAEERTGRTKRLAEAATALPPQQWFLDQLEALRQE
ncbi:alpha,alpha-trehalose-phosphate synthase [Streptomyces sp. CB00316]|uniref:alpha,alpha-trehalose-phosphate synthase (UDP-forming) n=1 Tax=unclassified Streptomyces TaxID=2593676 RepID=UPI00093C1D0F|nr:MULTISPECIES: trehalose-6-phosphate synthase [unclassified Streptomyces]MBT2427895.1 trehalose-6-phosphate synthase [Streptomyces sp. ISL-112]MBT2464594.1 trehalose-6-phosphate synthase [Streptomyces sp. ISL-63]OKJ20611.1 alpha,alpha-trehalose-phosphate synthase [Streptomyces sp. CB00316]